MTPPRRVLIAGCGDVGGELARRLLTRGVEVWGMRRQVGLLPPGVAPLRGDLAADDALPPLPVDLDSVVFTAAAGRRDDETYRAVYVGGLARLLAAVTATGAAPRIVYSSSTAVYGQSAGEEVDEDSPTAPPDFRGHRLLEAESLLARCGLEAVAARFGGIYGPGRTRLLDRARQDTPPADARLWTHRIHRDDAAAVLEHLLDLRSPPATLVAVDREPAPLAEVLAWLRRELGLPPLQPIDDPAVDDAAVDDAAIDDAAIDDTGRESGKRCSSRRLVASGFTFRYPTYREGYAALLGDDLAGRRS